MSSSPPSPLALDRGRPTSPQPVLDRDRSPLPSGYETDPAGFTEVLRAQAAQRAATPPRGSRRARAFDILLATAALLTSLPLLVIVTLLLVCSGQRPIFVHHRLGVGGRIFPCLKFQTMYPDAEDRLLRLLAHDELARAEWEADQKLTHDPRITAVGRVLRRTNLDELPQLVNVLLGHMSMVGPRPIVIGEVVRYGARYPSVAVVRPGLTGLWQISGRHRLRYEQRIELDLRYVRTRTLPGDLRIVAITIWQSLLTILSSNRFGGI